MEKTPYQLSVYPLKNKSWYTDLLLKNSRHRTLYHLESSLRIPMEERKLCNFISFEQF